MVQHIASIPSCPDDPRGLKIVDYQQTFLGCLFLKMPVNWPLLIPQCRRQQQGPVRPIYDRKIDPWIV
jgi:hypothetical protein